MTTRRDFLVGTGAGLATLGAHRLGLAQSGEQNRPTGRTRGWPVAERWPFTTHWLLAAVLRGMLGRGLAGWAVLDSSRPTICSTSRRASSTAGLPQPLGGGAAPSGKPDPGTAAGLSTG